jgi:hypothetical protein
VDEEFYARLNFFLVFESVLLSVVGILFTMSNSAVLILKVIAFLGLSMTLIWGYVLLFRDEDHIEIDHITPKSEVGGEELSNKCALHRHCHDQRHAKRVTECVHDN